MKLEGKDYIKKQAFFLGLCLILLAISLGLTISLEDLRALPGLIGEADLGLVLMVPLSILGFLLLQARAIKLLLASLGHDIGLGRTLVYSLVDYYFSAITPACMGGQPAEIYLMKKDGIDLGTSSLVMLVFNGVYHLSVVLVILVTTWGRLGQIFAKSPVFRGLFILGVAIQLGLSLLFFALVFSKTIFPSAIIRLARLLQSLPPLRDKDLVGWAQKTCHNYQKGASWIRSQPLILLRVLPLGLAHIFLYYSVSYLIMRALGLGGASLLDMVGLQGAYTMTFESIPLPSGLGLAEAGFLSLFGRIYPQALLPGVLVLTRGLTHYIFILLGALASLLGLIKKALAGLLAPLAS